MTISKNTTTLNAIFEGVTVERMLYQAIRYPEKMEIEDRCDKSIMFSMSALNGYSFYIEFNVDNYGDLSYKQISIEGMTFLPLNKQLIRLLVACSSHYDDLLAYESEPDAIELTLSNTGHSNSDFI